LRILLRKEELLNRILGDIIIAVVCSEKGSGDEYGRIGVNRQNTTFQ
jgi:hypothetical protein